jgi:hypothetical protein
MKNLFISICILLTFAFNVEARGLMMVDGGVAAAAPSLAYITSSGAGWQGISESQAVQFGASVPSGSLMTVGVCLQDQDPPAATSVSDGTNTYTRDVAKTTAGTERCAIYSAIAASTAQFTVTFTPTANARMIIAVAAFSGLTNNTPDGTPTVAVTGADYNNAHAGSITTTAAGVIVGITSNDRASAITQDANWTAEMWLQTADSAQNGSWCYRITSAGDAYNDGWTYTENSFWGAATVAYK